MTYEENIARVRELLAERDEIDRELEGLIAGGSKPTSGTVRATSAPTGGKETAFPAITRLGARIDDLERLGYVFRTERKRGDYIYHSRREAGGEATHTGMTTNLGEYRKCASCDKQECDCPERRKDGK
jgi:hypothetical protein